jgi:hypothetical protein
LGIEVHKRIDFLFGSFPVFHTERIYRQRFDPEVNAALRYFFDGLSALAMTFGSGQPFFLRPSAVPIHNDRYMAGNLFDSKPETFGRFFKFLFEALHLTINKKYYYKLNRFNFSI